MLSNLGYAYMLASEWGKARTSLEKAIDLDDGLAEAHNNLAIVLSKLGDENGALRELSKTGTPAVAFNNMGVLYLEAEKTERARYSSKKQCVWIRDMKLDGATSRRSRRSRRDNLVNGHPETRTRRERRKVCG